VATTSSDARLVRLDLDDARWRDFVEGAPGALPFHRPSWPLFLAECYGFPAFALALAHDDGRIDAGVPVLEVHRPFAGRRWVCLPFTDVCQPLGGDDSIARLVTAANAERSRTGVKELEVRAAVEAPGFVTSEVATRHVLRLGDDPDEMFRGFRSSTRQGIRAAERESVRVETATSREGLTEVFYDLHAATRRRLGVPVQGRRFFELLWDRVLEPGGGSVLVASVGNEPIAAAVFLAAGDTVIYKFGASDADAWRLRPNNALFWTAIRDACADGRRYLDFGRSDHESEGLRRFKSSWGAEEIPLVYSSTRPTAVAHTGPPGRLGRAASFVIRRSPPVVCRVIGRAFYRYAA
jgi:CelD/BcsL family acetyltransferase involved in cellulose biosynthesis